MPRTISITREQILDAAFVIAREQGAERLSARTVADAIGCSPQPIYRAYGSMKKLREDVFGRAAEVAMGYLTGEDIQPPYMAMAYGNLRFAQREPHLYRLITESDQVVADLLNGAELPPFILEQLQQIPGLEEMEGDQLQRIHALMWFFSLGIASVFRANIEGDPMPLARHYLDSAGQAVIEWEKAKVRS
jgi:AcrR family transcriptional regulator